MKKTKLAIAIAAATLISAPAYATNGMNMAGYGAISTGMGGTAQAYNNGLGGMMNNPATMGMGAVEGNKLQVGVGMLGPDVKANFADMVKQDSDGTSYYMPGIGYARKKDGITWGLGVLGQGGMGTEYNQSNSGIFAGGYANNGSQVPLIQGDNRSELSVGRILLPVNMEVNDKLTVGGSIDYVWAGLDMLMTVSGFQIDGMARQNLIGGSMAGALAGDLSSAKFDFSNGSDYTGQAKGSGFGGKLGLTYKFSDNLTFGASYHSKTNLSDLTGDAKVLLDTTIDNNPTPTMEMSGEIRVKDFQWPETIAMGFAFKPNDQWLVTADYKRINWSDTMENFSMTFKADPAFGGGTLDLTLPQNWDDQDVFMLGTAYKMNKQLTLRAGLNVANNPIPEEMTNPLFPATIEKHYTVGFGYNFDQSQSIDFSLTHAPEVTVTAPQALPDGLGGVTYADMDISHSQTNWQLLYTYKWGITPKK